MIINYLLVYFIYNYPKNWNNMLYTIPKKHEKINFLAGH